MNSSYGIVRDCELDQAVILTSAAFPFTCQLFSKKEETYVKGEPFNYFRGITIAQDQVEYWHSNRKGTHYPVGRSQD